MADPPFRTQEPTEEELREAYYSEHDLRDMYSRDNTERRRTGGHTLRRLLTGPQDKKLTGLFPKIREAYEVYNNDDVVTVFAQQLIEEGKADELDPKLRAIAEQSKISERRVPFDETITHDAEDDDGKAPVPTARAGPNR